MRLGVGVGLGRVGVGNGIVGIGTYFVTSTGFGVAIGFIVYHVGAEIGVAGNLVGVGRFCPYFSSSSSTVG